MTVLSAGGERPPGRAAAGGSRIPPSFPACGTETLPLLGLGRAGPREHGQHPRGWSQQRSVPWSPALGTNPPCCPGAGSGPACKDGASRGPAWGTAGGSASPAPSSKNLHGQALPGAYNLQQTGRTGWFEPASFCQLRDRWPVLWGWFSGKTDQSIANRLKASIRTLG